jgi:hypothetical protein
LFQVKSLVASGALPQLRGGYGKTTKKAWARLKFMYIFNPSFKRVIAGDRPIPDLPFLTILFIPFLVLWNRAEFLPKPHIIII